MRAIAISIFLFSACGGSSGPTTDALCDTAQLKLTCTHSNGQCVEYSGLSTRDDTTNENNGSCDTGGAPCPTANRLGTCNLPPTSPNTGIKCSPDAVILIRYFAPFVQSNAQSLCQGVPGAVWTPN